MTAVFAFGVKVGAGQCASERCVRVGMCLLSISKLRHDTLFDGYDSDRCVICGIGAGNDGLGRSHKVVNCLSDTEYPIDPDKSIRKNASFLLFGFAIAVGDSVSQAYSAGLLSA